MLSYFLALASASRTNSSPHPTLSHDEFPVGLVLLTCTKLFRLSFLTGQRSGFHE